jgi:hypothetical protein
MDRIWTIIPSANLAREALVKKALNIFAIVIAALGLGIALTIALNAPPPEEHLEGYIFISNAVERSSAMLRAWMIALGSIAGALFFAALGAIVDRLEAIRDALKRA